MAGLVNWVTDKVSELVLGDEEEDKKKEAEAAAKAPAGPAGSSPFGNIHGPLEDRPTGAQREKLQTIGMLTREQTLRLTARFMTVLQQPETKARLKKAVEEKKVVEKESTEIQRHVLEEMGIDGDHGVSCISQIRHTFAQDPPVLMMFMRMVQTESLACDEAELSPEEFQAKIKQMQEAAAQAQAMHGFGGGPAHGGAAGPGGAHGHGHGGPQQMRQMPPQMMQMLKQRAKAQLQSLASMPKEERDMMFKQALDQFAAMEGSAPNDAARAQLANAKARVMATKALVEEGGLSDEDRVDKLISDQMKMQGGMM